MILHLISALALALLIVSYWILCRKRALKYQTKAAELMEMYFEDRSVPEHDKKALYRDYMLSRRWYVMPVCAVLTPVLLAYMLIAKGKLDSKPVIRANRKLYDEAFDQFMKMTISKCPLISIASMAIMGLSFAVAIPVAVILNRLSSMPTPAGIANLFSVLGAKAARKAHLH